jgi:hypothetical protein
MPPPLAGPPAVGKYSTYIFHHHRPPRPSIYVLPLLFSILRAAAAASAAARGVVIRRRKRNLLPNFLQTINKRRAGKPQFPSNAVKHVFLIFEFHFSIFPLPPSPCTSHSLSFVHIFFFDIFPLSLSKRFVAARFTIINHFILHQLAHFFLSLLCERCWRWCDSSSLCVFFHHFAVKTKRERCRASHTLIAYCHHLRHILMK